MPDSPDPRAEYTTRLVTRRARLARHERLDLRVAQARFTSILLTLAIAWLSWARGAVSAWWIAAPVAAFVGLAVFHARVIQNKKRAMRAVAFYDMGLARINDAWMGRGQSTELFADESHLYTADLDLFGKGSLFELLCTARTRSGEETLAGWLMSSPTQADILARQAAVDELRARIDLREDLAIIGPDIRSSIHPAAMSEWGAAPAQLTSPWWRVSGAVLSATLMASAISTWPAGADPRWRLAFYVTGTITGLFALVLRNRVRAVLSGVEEPKHDLELLATLLARLERESFQTALLVALRARLWTDAAPPSRQIKRLVNLVDLLPARQSDGIVVPALFLARQIVFAPFSFMLWATQIACAVEVWRRRSGPQIATWLSVVGEFEALCALAAYAYEHPADPFPEVTDAGPFFESDGLGHPLIPSARCVSNDVRLNAARQLLVVSGSNMSGKSTLLRTVGVNAVLAFAGAPVRATRLRVSRLAIGATLRIQDSLQAGTSRFYAEIQRFRHIMDLTEGDRPVLFLLDEILHGTNSHDRAIGAEALVRALVARGAIGLVTTHDLALARVADALAPRAANVHFEDDIRDGKMVFDYRMQPGVVTKSNALELMRAVGLDVE